MANEGLQLKATATVKLLKYEGDKLVGTEEHTVDLTEEEANALWHSQQQA